MAKDGTVRGGARVRSGPMPANIKEQMMLDVGVSNIPNLPAPSDMIAETVPPVDEFMLDIQKDGSKLEAERIYQNTYLWLRQRGCEKLIPNQLLTGYSMSVARWIQAERYISKYGSLAKHPVSGNPIKSPYVTMSQDYMKQITNAWFQIYSIVRDNGSNVGDLEESDLYMEHLLKQKLK